MDISRHLETYPLFIFRIDNIDRFSDPFLFRKFGIESFRHFQWSTISNKLFDVITQTEIRVTDAYQ